MSEEPTRPSSPDEDEIEITTDETLDPKAAARRARRAKAKLALRIPDDEVVRPQAPKINGDADATPIAPGVRSSSPSINDAAEIKPARIISVGPPPPAPEEDPLKDTVEAEKAPPPPRVPSAPPTVPMNELPEELIARPTVVDLAEKASGDDEGFDVPVDEDEPEYRPRMPTIPSNPPPPPGAEIIKAKTVSEPPKPRVPSSEDALEIDDVEAAAVLSSRPPPRPLAPPMAPAVPPAPRLPTISTKTPAVPLPADALSSTPNLEEPKTRPRAAALVDDEEAGNVEEVEPERASAPPASIESGDEIDTTELETVAPVIAEAKNLVAPVPPQARPVSTPPKPAPAAKPPPPKDVPKTGAMIPIVAPTPASNVATQLAPPPLAENLVPRRRARPWWEDLFNDDFIRTMPKFTPAQVAAEVDFIEDSLGVARGGSLLDLGCGTGRQAVELSRRGYAVVGFDLSLAMLARAGEEAQEQNQKINFVQGDMREMTFEEAFDGIYCWGSTFGYFEEEKNAHVISKVHKALRQGGQFLLDTVSRDFVIKQSPSLAWFEGEGCVCMDEMAVDWITSRMRVKRTMMLDDGRSKEIEYSIRIYSLARARQAPSRRGLPRRRSQRSHPDARRLLRPRVPAHADPRRKALGIIAQPIVEPRRAPLAEHPPHGLAKPLQREHPKPLFVRLPIRAEPDRHDVVDRHASHVRALERLPPAVGEHHVAPRARSPRPRNEPELLHLRKRLADRRLHHRKRPLQRPLRHPPSRIRKTLKHVEPPRRHSTLPQNPPRPRPTPPMRLLHSPNRAMHQNLRAPHRTPHATPRRPNSPTKVRIRTAVDVARPGPGRPRGQLEPEFGSELWVWRSARGGGGVEFFLWRF